MLISVKREPSAQGATLGSLFVDGVFECYTLEPEVREPKTGRPLLWDKLVAWVKSWKVFGKTAIPCGTYEVTINHSAHFGRDLPQILGVPGFDGVRIHPGNKAADTEGCTLVGKSKEANLVLQSKAAFEPLFEKIAAAISAGQKVYYGVS